MRVLVVCDGNLLISSIADLLSHESRITLLIAKNARSEISQKVESFKPEVIITDDLHWPAERMEYFETLQTRLDVKVIVVHTQQNMMNMYLVKQVVVTKPGDLLSAIYSE